MWSTDQTGPEAAGALSGVRVLDLSRVLAGPYATMMLGDMGADVLKVESPTGDDTRAWGPPYFQGQSTYFLSVNRNKRTLVADLREPADRERVQELAATADIVVENFRPGVAERLGVGYDDLRPANPGLVYCSITAFGDAPQARALPGYDLLVQAVGGLMSVTGDPDGEPTKAGVAVVDVLAGLHAVSGMLAGLRHRDRTGVGQRLDVSLLGTLLASLVNQSSAFLCTGTVPQRTGNAHPSLAPYATFRAKDGELVLAVGNDRQFAALCAVLGEPALAGDPRFAHNPDRVAIATSSRHGWRSCCPATRSRTWSPNCSPSGCRPARSTTCTRRSTTPGGWGWTHRCRCRRPSTPRTRRRCRSRRARCGCRRRRCATGWHRRGCRPRRRSPAVVSPSAGDAAPWGRHPGAARPPCRWPARGPAHRGPRRCC
jgi:crotonobetainyl-CoA:carnitine CoA-transferase CaiB-like acyl-CoA transferase